MFLNDRLISSRRRMMALVAIIAVFWLFIDSAFSYEDRETETQKHFIWSVESDKNTVYLLGSIHVLRPDSYPLPPAIENIYNCCVTIVFETDFEGENDPAKQSSIIQRGLYPAGQTLSENISGQTYKLLQDRFKASGLSSSQFEKFRPWIVAQTVAGMEFIRLGLDPNLGVDRHFFKKAQQDGKRMFFLESNEFQINLIADMSSGQQEAFLEGVLKEIDIIQEMSSDMFQAWKTGDVDKLASILQMSHAVHADIYDRFFTQRNKSWVPEIEKLMKQHGDILIIVGAGHLVGTDSVIDLLMKKGYKVRQR